MSGIYRGPNGSATADALNIDGNKGDLTISNSGLEWTINPDTVNFSKMQNISTDVLLGRATSGSGDIEEITCTPAGRALLDDANASAQRTTLGLGNAATATIGTNVLAFDSNLQGFVDTFTLPTTDATNGFVLTTNGAGTLSLTAPGGIPDGDKGDIAVSSGGTVWTVDTDAITTTKILDDSVTYAKIQNVSATDKLLGRSSSGAGNIEEITCTSAGRALLDDVDASAQRTTLGLGALALQGDGDKGDITVSASGTTWTIDNDVVTPVKLSPTAKPSKINDIDASVASNNLTITINSYAGDFRSTTLTDGTPISRTLASPVSLVIPNGATLGATNAVEATFVVGLLDNAGTLEPFVINLAGGNQLDETNLITTTTIGTGSDSNNVAYSTTGRTSLAYRIVGIVKNTQATAGTYATAPSLVQGTGGMVNKIINSTAMVRLNTANGYGSTNTVIRRFTNVVNNQGSDITYTDSATLGSSFTINVNGVYSISYSDTFNAPSACGISLNSSQLTTGINSINVSDILTVNLANNTTFSLTQSSWTGYLLKGSVIRPHAQGAVTGLSPNTTQLTIARVA